MKRSGMCSHSESTQFRPWLRVPPQGYRQEKGRSRFSGTNSIGYHQADSFHKQGNNSHSNGGKTSDGYGEEDGGVASLTVTDG
jgi:hypothetical protein